MRTAVVIPARDEEHAIGDVVAGARTALPAARVIVVDDASRDRTASRARANGAEVLSLPTGAGYAGALRAGYRAALAGPMDALVQMDGDGQHRAGDLPRLLMGLADADMVIGSRFLGPTPGYRIPVLRRVGMAACRWMGTAADGLCITDPTSGLRAMTPRAVARLAHHGFPGGLTETTLLIHMRRAGFRIGEIPVLMRASTGRSMHDGLAGGAHFLRIAWSLRGLGGGPDRDIAAVPAEPAPVPAGRG